jgi:hypothetical protein
MARASLQIAATGPEPCFPALLSVLREAVARASHKMARVSHKAKQPSTLWLGVTTGTTVEPLRHRLTWCISEFN